MAVVASEDSPSLLHPPAQRTPGNLAFHERHNRIFNLVLGKNLGGSEQPAAIALLGSGLTCAQADEQHAGGRDAGELFDQQRRTGSSVKPAAIHS